tara:strand:+ start:169 stop:1053 length:885 start_codon:yes stop_codon:yes gene_type:complete
MPTFKTNYTRKSGTLVQHDDSSDYLFSSISKDKEGAREMRHLDAPTEKIVLDSQNILIHCKNGWTKISLSNVKEDETWTGWDNYFKKAKLLKNSLMGYDDKNQKFVSAIDEEDGNMVIAFGNEIITTKDEDLTMAVIQRYNSSSTRFDVTWCVHSENRVITSTFEKSQYEDVLNYLAEVTEHVYDAGAESYDWKNFLKVQTKQGGDENDWIGTFAPLTDEEGEEEDEDEDFSLSDEEEGEEEEEEEEEVAWDNESETDEDSDDELLLESESESDEDDIEGCEEEYEPVIKRRRL